jgi:hypothetical protein
MYLLKELLKWDLACESHATNGVHMIQVTLSRFKGLQVSKGAIQSLQLKLNMLKLGGSAALVFHSFTDCRDEACQR